MEDLGWDLKDVSKKGLQLFGWRWNPGPKIKE